MIVRTFVVKKSEIAKLYSIFLCSLFFVLDDYLSFIFEIVIKKYYWWRRRDWGRKKSCHYKVEVSLLTANKFMTFFCQKSGSKILLYFLMVVMFNMAINDNFLNVILRNYLCFYHVQKKKLQNNNNTSE